MKSPPDMTVIIDDLPKDSLAYRQIDRKLRTLSRNVRILHRPSVEKIADSDNLFLLTSATGLPEMSELIEAAERRHQLRVLFVQLNIDANFIPQMIQRAHLRSMHNAILYSDFEIPNRVLTAWKAGAQEQLIATATVAKDRLFVTDCSINTWEIPFDSLPALKAIPADKRTEFEIDEDGSYLYWPSADIHLEMEALRAAVDPELQEKLAAKKAMHDRRFGEGVAAVRKAHKLKQTDIPGVSERHIRRIEKGDSPKLATLRKLAQAHEMSVNEYLEEVAQNIAKIAETTRS